MMKFYIKIFNFLFILFQGCFMQADDNYVISAFGEVEAVQPTPIIQLKFPYNINSDFCVTSATGSGSVTYSRPFVVLNISGTTGSSATLQSKNRFDYRCGQGGLAIFTAVFNTGITGTQQIVGLGNTGQGYFFGYTGTSFGIMRRNEGVDTWIDQSSWNGDKLDGSSGTSFTLDTTKGNVYKIQFQWLGFGAIKFYLEKPTDGSWVLAHTIQYGNSNTGTSVNNSSFQSMANVSNIENSSEVTLKVPSMAALNEGESNNDLYNYTYRSTTGSASSMSAAAGEALILSIQNINFFTGMSGFTTGQSNQTMVFLQSLSVVQTTGGGSPVAILLYKNPTLTSTSYTPVDGSTSVVLKNTAGSISSPGMLLATNYLGIANATRTIFWDLKDYNIWLAPGDVLLIAGLVAAGTGQSVTLSLQWVEKQ